MGSPCGGHWAAGCRLDYTFLTGLVGAYSTRKIVICSVEVGVDYCSALFRRSTVTDIMDASGHSSPIWAYRANAHKMRVSHDEDSSDPKDLCSLGVVGLDLSLSPDAFGLQAFDSKKPLTRMLPGSSPCELRLMLPDSKLGGVYQD